MNELVIFNKVYEYVDEMRSSLECLLGDDNIIKLIETLLYAYDVGNKVIVFGNGGSGCTAAHLVQDLAKHTIVNDKKDEAAVNKRFQAICLNESVSVMTTWANDAGYEKVFSEQLKNFVSPNDVVIGITSSGNTPNIVKALEVANEYEATSVAFTGGTGGKAKEISKQCICIKSKVNYCVEDALACVVHILCDILRNHIQGKENVA